MVFCFVQNFFFGQHKSQNVYFFCRAKRVFFTSEFNIRLYDKNSESDYFFFLHQNQNIFFSNIGNQNIFLEKKHNPPPPPPFKLNGRSLSNISNKIPKAFWDILNNLNRLNGENSETEEILPQEDFIKFYKNLKS